MALASTHHEVDELGGGKVRHVQYMKRIAYWDAGSLVRSVNDFVDGDASWPHVVAQASQPLYTAADGMRRFHPTREADRYLEIGAPYIKPSTTWQKVNLGTATRTANRLAWTTTNANVYIDHGGHFVKMGIVLKNGWVPPNGQVAFPVGISGLTRSGGNILRDGVVVAHLKPPVVYDLDNAMDTRPIAWEFVSAAGQAYVLFTLPSLTGMSRPVVDPTLTLQPDATDGQDTWIYAEGAGKRDNNYGITAYAWSWNHTGGLYARPLLQFDLSSIAGATVSSAILTLRTTISGDEISRNIAAHRALTQWYEGAKSDAVPDPGQDGSVWNYRNYNGSVAWAGGAGGGSGSDYAAVATATVAVSTNSTAYDWTVTADVSAWVGGTANYGWWMMADATGTDSYKSFSTSDDATASYRPKLVVEYTEAEAAVKPIRAPGWGRW